MNYTEKQISNAKYRYSQFLQKRTAQYYEIAVIGMREAEERAERHNNIVTAILRGDKELERKWKLFFLDDEAEKDAKEEQRKAKLKANKEASADVLAPIKKMRKLGDFGKWLNNKNNPYRSQHFSKKYTEEAVSAYLETLK